MKLLLLILFYQLNVFAATPSGPQQDKEHTPVLIVHSFVSISSADLICDDSDDDDDLDILRKNYVLDFSVLGFQRYCDQPQFFSLPVNRDQQKSQSILHKICVLRL